MDERILQIVLRARDEASAKLRDFQSRADKVGQSMTDMGGKMALLGAAPTAGILLASKAAIDFESSFAGVRKTVDASESEFKALSDNFRGIAKTTPVAVNELNKIGEMAGQLGVSGVDNLTVFTKTMADMAVTTNLTSEEAATSFARIANIMGEPIQNVDRMGSSVVDLGNNFATTEAEIVEFANRIAGAGKIAGLTTPDVFSIGAAMSSVGVQAEAGGTAVQKVLLSMNEAAIMGGDSLESFASTAGLSSQEFQEAWKENPTEIFAAFVTGLGDQGDQAMQTLSDLGLEDQRLIRAFLSLANAGDLVIDTLKVGDGAWKENNALAEEAGKRYETTASQLQVFKNQMYDLGIVIGGAILPALSKIVEFLTPVITAFSNFASEHPVLIASLLGIGAAIGVLGVALMGLGMMISGLGAVATVASGIFGVLGGAIGLISLPVLLVIGAIAALVAIGWLLWKNWDMIKIKAQEVWTAVTTAFNSFVTWVGAGVNAIRGALVTFFTVTIPQAINTAVNWFSQLPAKIGAFLTDLFLVKIPFAIGFAHAFITVAIPTIIRAFLLWFGMLPVRIHEFFRQVQEHIIRIIGQVIGWLGQVIPQLVTNIGNWLAQVPPTVWRIFTEAYNFIWNIITTAVTWLIETLSALPEQISGAISSIPNIVSNVFEQAKEWALQKMSDLYEGVMGWWDKISGIFGKIGDAIGNAVGAVKGAFGAGSKAGAGMIFENGGFVPRTGMAMVHQGEYVLSRDMLRGRQPIHAGVGVSNGGQTFNITAQVREVGDVDMLTQKLAFKMKTAGNI